MRLDMWLNFPKFKNSTKQPVSDPDYTLNIDLKGDDSILSPILKLQGVPSTCVYARIHELGRYYFVKDVRWLTNDIVEYSLEVDPLASYKETIGASTHFIERCSNGYDLYLDDPLISQRQNFFERITNVTTLPWYDNGNGAFIVQLANHPSSAESGLSLYAMDKTAVADLLTNILNTDVIASAVDDLITALFDPMKYIISIKWMPIDIGAIQGTTEQIKLGAWDKVLATGKRITEVGHVWSRALNLPSDTYHDFRDFSSKYTRCKMAMPGLGLIDLDAIDFVNGLSAEYVVDYQSGDAKIRLNTNDSSTICIATFNTKLSADIQLSQVVTNINGILSGALSTAGSAISGNPIATATSAIDTFVATLNPTISVIGKSDNRTVLKNENAIGIFTRRIECNDIPIFTSGRPCAKYKRIDTIPGYIKCGNASLSISCTDTERDAINSYLNSGFYYE